MKNFLFLFSLISYSSFAQVHVHVVDPDMDVSPLENQGYHITRGEKTFSSLPDKEKRDLVLGDVPESKQWDELDKDIFFMDLKNKSIEQLEKKYPKMTKSKLQRLKAHVK